MIFPMFAVIKFPLSCIGCSCRFLIQYVHPATAPVAVVGLVLLFYSMMFLLKAGCTDPGFIPRARADETAYNKDIGDVGKTQD